VELSDHALVMALLGLLLLLLVFISLMTTNEYRVEVLRHGAWHTEYRTANWQDARRLAWEIRRADPGGPDLKIRIYDTRQDRYLLA
jgi:hypothetical protein